MDNQQALFKRLRAIKSLQSDRKFLINDPVKLSKAFRGIPKGTRGRIVALASSEGLYAVSFNFGSARGITLDIDPKNLTLVDMS